MYVQVRRRHRAPTHITNMLPMKRRMMGPPFPETVMPTGEALYPPPEAPPWQPPPEPTRQATAPVWGQGEWGRMAGDIGQRFLGPQGEEITQQPTQQAPTLPYQLPLSEEERIQSEVWGDVPVWMRTAEAAEKHLAGRGERREERLQAAYGETMGKPIVFRRTEPTEARREALINLGLKTGRYAPEFAAGIAKRHGMPYSLEEYESRLPLPAQAERARLEYMREYPEIAAAPQFQTTRERTYKTPWGTETETIAPMPREPIKQYQPGAIENTETGEQRPYQWGQTIPSGWKIVKEASTVINIGGKPASPSERTAIAETRASIDALDNLKMLFDNQQTRTGPVTGRIDPTKGLFGWTTDEQEAFMAATSAFKNKIIKEITGAQMSEVEAQRIMKQVPDITDPPQRWQAKWEQSKRNLDFLQNRRMEILKQSGITAPMPETVEGRSIDEEMENMSDEELERIIGIR